MLIDGLDLLNIFNWKEITPIVSADKIECPAYLASRKYSLYLLHENIKFQCLEVMMSMHKAVVQAVLFYILELNIFDLLRE